MFKNFKAENIRTLNVGFEPTEQQLKLLDRWLTIRENLIYNVEGSEKEYDQILNDSEIGLIQALDHEGVRKGLWF